MYENGTLDPISKWARDINKILTAYRDIASSISTHGGLIGESREFFITEILRRFIPKSVDVGTGQIIGFDDKLSKQIDIIVSRVDYPVLSSLAKSNVYYSESIIATIEVKSSLTGGKSGPLWKALNNSLSVKQTEIDHSLQGVKNNFHDLKWLTPSAYIFGYQGYKNKLNDLKVLISSWISANKPSFLELPDIIVTEGCVVIKNDYKFFDSNTLRTKNDYDCIFLAARETEGLTWLIYHLLDSISEILGRPQNKRSGASYSLRKNHFKRKNLEKSCEKWGKWDSDSATQRGAILKL